MCPMYNPPPSKWIRIALANLDFEITNNRLSDRSAMADKIKFTLQSASELSADIVVFPEYSSDESFDDLFHRSSKDNKYVIISGSCIREHSGKLHNTCSVFDPRGTQHQIKKRHLTPFEETTGFVVPYTEDVYDEILTVMTKYGEIDLLVKICLDFI